MEISVWDTYVARKDGGGMHFDILVPSSVTDPSTIHGYGRSYLESKYFETGILSANECKFCHIQTAPSALVQSIRQFGYHILELENCH